MKKKIIDSIESLVIIFCITFNNGLILLRIFRMYPELPRYPTGAIKAAAATYWLYSGSSDSKAIKVVVPIREKCEQLQAMF